MRLWHAHCALSGPEGRYHVTTRGNERKNIFRDDTDHFHFLDLLSELGERFGLKVHAYVLMAPFSTLNLVPSTMISAD